jgi:hypothetical protein
MIEYGCRGGNVLLFAYCYWGAQLLLEYYCSWGCVGPLSLG